MRVLISLVAVGGLFLVGLLGGVPWLGWLFGIVIPYLAVLLFFGGLVHRVLGWANSAVPFRITTTCGQQKSLPWIKQQKLENPHTAWGVIGRMALEILFFRSLLRNTRSELVDGKRLVYSTEILLWLSAMVMHWAFLVILIRHLRLVASPEPFFVNILTQLDGFMEIGVPVIYISSFAFVLGLLYLLFRRLSSPQFRYISLVEDYFALFLLLGIGISGIFLRHLTKTDVTAVKELAMGLATFRPGVPESPIAPLFYGHFFLVCMLLAYFPFGKLVHAPGVFLSPTRNLANNNRAVRHVNPWDYPVKLHPYDEYEDELRDKMKAAGIPVERQ